MQQLPLDDRRLLDWMARDFMRGASQLTPPYDIDALARHLGVRVEEDWDQSGGAGLGFQEGRPDNLLGLAGSTAPLGAFIFDDEDEDERHIRLTPGLGSQRRLVLAHELAHAVLEHDKLHQLRGHRAVPPPSVLEAHAQYTAHQFLSGVEAFARAVESAAGDKVPSLRQILDVRRMFDLKPYVAIRSYVEHASRPAAVLSLISKETGFFRVVGYGSAFWSGPVWTGPDWIPVVSDDPIAFRAQILLDEPRNENRARDIVKHVRHRCHAEKVAFHLSRSAVHLLIHRMNDHDTGIAAASETA